MHGDVPNDSGLARKRPGLAAEDGGDVVEANLHAQGAGLDFGGAAIQLPENDGLFEAADLQLGARDEQIGRDGLARFFRGNAEVLL